MLSEKFELDIENRAQQYEIQDRTPVNSVRIGQQTLLI